MNRLNCGLLMVAGIAGRFTRRDRLMPLGGSASIRDYSLHAPMQRALQPSHSGQNEQALQGWRWRIDCPLCVTVCERQFAYRTRQTFVFLVFVAPHFLVKRCRHYLTVFNLGTRIGGGGRAARNSGRAREGLSLRPVGGGQDPYITRRRRSETRNDSGSAELFSACCRRHRWLAPGASEGARRASADAPGAACFRRG